ncbi:MAG: PAS domain S-box protein [Treponema sp.]|jgi:PAS domain S-box-containing protein|nr:PAS domain S-box protein [Treponema sp.]
MEDDLIRAGSMLSRELDFKNLCVILVEQAQDISHSDLTAFYFFKSGRRSNPGDLSLVHKRGSYTPPEKLSGDSAMVRFLLDCRETLVFNNREGEGKRPGFFKEILLVPEMKSGMVLPVSGPSRNVGILVVNSRSRLFYTRRRFYFLDSFAKLAGGAMQSARLFGELKGQMQKIESMERYQENVFNSMTNMIITLDGGGQIHYFNYAASEAMGLDENCLGLDMGEVFKNAVSPRTIKTIRSSLTDGSELLGLQGIYKNNGREIDYSLNASPLRGPRGRNEGLTLLFTNQTRENELKSRVQEVTEDRRKIKDMFCRYMSNEVVSNLMESPELIKLGGDKKNATVFFADIRGYTSFSEGREPEEIIEILNAFFGQAVEHILNYQGYIDKFIGDCIMAVWGVPLEAENNGAAGAVSCALAIQENVRSSKRSFFKRDAARLKIGIGVNTGPLVAGNLGSLQRMDYSVIGDTVNLAARLESMAGPDEIIISQATRDELGDGFRLEKRPDVNVKGKGKPVQIYNVLGIR